MKTNLLGLIEDLPNEDYQKGPGTSASDIVKINDEGFEAWIYSKAHPKASTDSMILGSVTHSLVEAEIKSDPNVWKAAVAIMPDLNLRTNAGKDALAEFERANAGKYVVKQDVFDHAQRMRDAVFNEPVAAAYLRGGLSEASIFVRHPVHGILMKTRPDFLRPSDGLSVNFKTTDDCSNAGWIRSIADYGYDWKSAWYLDVLAIHYGRDFDEIHINVEKNKDGGPCRVAIKTVPADVLNFVRTQYEPILPLIAEFERSGSYPKLPAQLECPEIPDWAVRKCAYV